MRLARLRQGGAALMLVSGALLLFAPPTMAQDDVRTETELFGFAVEAEASPLSVRIFADFIPIPTDPGDPQFELTASYTNARLGTGPNGRAVASSVWPGPALGDGWGTVVGDESQSYPIRAGARYPGAGEEDWSESQTLPAFEGVGMTASARGLDASARSEGAGVPGPAEPVAAPGAVRSRADATVRDGAAVATSVSSISELSLLEGLIVLEDVRTELEARSDGTAAETSGTTKVGAVSVFGQRVQLTDSGVDVVAEDGGDDGSDEPDLGAQLDPVDEVVQRLTSDLVADGIEETLGVRIEALDQAETIDGVIGERTARGVRIAVDLQVLRDYLEPLVDLLPVGEALDALPSDLAEVQGIVLELLRLGPTLEVIVGRGAVASSASPPFEAPEPPPPPDPASADAPPPLSSSGSASLPGTSASGSTPVPSGSAEAPQAEVAPPEATPPPTVAASEPLPRFHGIPAPLAAVVLFMAAVPTYGLRALREAAVGAGASLEPSRSLPDLRGGA